MFSSLSSDFCLDGSDVVKRHHYIRMVNEPGGDEEWTEVIDDGYQTVPAGSKFWIACEVPYFD